MQLRPKMQTVVIEKEILSGALKDKKADDLTNELEDDIECG